MLRRILPALCIAATLLVGEASAWAQAATPEAADLAKQRFREGAQAYAERRYKDAIDLFLEADRVAPNPAFAYNIGLAYEDLGDADNALMWYRKYLRDLPDAPDRKEIETRIRTAENRLRERAVQQVTVLSIPAAATVSIDGERVGVTPWTGQLKPGHHRVDAELRGYQDATEMLELPSDHAIDFTVTLHPVTPAPTSAPAPVAPRANQPAPTPVQTEPTGLGRVHLLTWGAIGVGVAGLGTALAFELARSAAVDDARHASTNLEGKDSYDRAKTDQTLARVSLAVGSAFAVAGAALLYLDLTSGKRAGPEARAALGCRGPTCGVIVHGRF